MNLRMQNKIYYVKKDTITKKTYGLIIFDFLFYPNNIFLINVV